MKSIDKAKAFEREVARKLKEIWPNAQRGLGQPRAGHECPDIENCDNYWIECKVGARPNIHMALQQAMGYIVRNKSKKIPVVIARKDRCGTTVTMPLDDWMDLIDGH